MDESPNPAASEPPPTHLETPAADLEAAAGPAAAMREIDTNENGVVDSAEFVAAGGTQEEFNQLDLDGDGILDADEQASAMVRGYSFRALISDLANGCSDEVPLVADDDMPSVVTIEDAERHRHTSMIHGRRKSFREIGEHEDGSDEEADDAEAERPKFQLKPFSWCKVGLMRQTAQLEYIPQPKAASYLNCRARLHWLAEVVMEESPLLAVQAGHWIERRSLPGIQLSPDELAKSLHKAMVTAGLAGYKLTQHDVRQLSVACGCTVRGVHVPFVLPEDLVMCLEEYQERRRLIKKDPDVRAVLRSFWGITKTIKGGQARYVELHLAIHKALTSARTFDEAATRQQLVHEWLIITGGGEKAMSYHLFADPLYHLADVWTLSARPGVYAHFLASLLSAISVAKDANSAALSLLPLEHTCFMEVFCKQLWRSPHELDDEDSEVPVMSDDEGSSLASYSPLPPELADCVITKKERAINPAALKRSLQRKKSAMKSRSQEVTLNKSSLVAQMLQANEAMASTHGGGSTVIGGRGSVLHASGAIHTKPSSPRRYRALPECANVPPLGRLATPNWHTPQLEDAPIWRGDGRLEFTFGRKCLHDFWEGSQTARLGARHNVYSGARAPPTHPFPPMPPKTTRVRFPAPNKGKYVRMPPLVSRSGGHAHSDYFRAPMSARVADFQRAGVLPPTQ